MLSFSETVESETISGFDFPFPEEMPFSLHQAQVDWWKTHYRQALIALRTRKVDRYSAYKAMAKVLQIVLAFCWVHVRRDFLKVASSWPQYESWAFS